MYSLPKPKTHHPFIMFISPKNQGILWISESQCCTIPLHYISWQLKDWNTDRQKTCHFENDDSCQNVNPLPWQISVPRQKQAVKSSIERKEKKEKSPDCQINELSKHLVEWMYPLMNGEDLSVQLVGVEVEQFLLRGEAKSSRRFRIFSPSNLLP